MLLDTHIAVWAALDPDALTEAERKRMAGTDTQLVLSAVAIWELRLKWHSFHISGARKGPINPAAVAAFAEAIAWELLPLTARHAAAELAQPLGHKDPFDELLLVQAQEEGMRLLTRDAKLVGSPVFRGRRVMNLARSGAVAGSLLAGDWQAAHGARVMIRSA